MPSRSDARPGPYDRASDLLEEMENVCPTAVTTVLLANWCARLNEIVGCLPLSNYSNTTHAARKGPKAA